MGDSLGIPDLLIMQSAEEGHVTPIDLQNEGFQEKLIKKEEEEDGSYFCEGSFIPVEHVTSEEHLTPEDQQCGGFQMKPVKKEEAEDKDDLKLNKDFCCQTSSGTVSINTSLSHTQEEGNVCSQCGRSFSTTR
ncbi:uncharacterized protein LOC134328777 isoform X3 [Trichomycterus rosablanca]|uniref:uncharacterized protein LOC134328776 isoform X4 n=1 Tax=Trichomycterus rosablanca TaxID=2290929 RepID=UPI002F353C0C